MNRYAAIQNPLRPRHQLALARDAALRSWVVEPGSMTRAIARHCQGQPAVVVHKSALDRASKWETRLLKQNPGDRVFAREISLQIRGQSVLDARSITPAGGSIEARLRGLGNKPLAELLFEDPLWQRLTGPLILAGRTDISPPGRVCVWRYQGRRPGTLLVAEYFLPALLAQPRRAGAVSSNQQDAT